MWIPYVKNIKSSSTLGTAQIFHNKTRIEIFSHLVIRENKQKKLKNIPCMLFMWNLLTCCFKRYIVKKLPLLFIVTDIIHQYMSQIAKTSLLVSICCRKHEKVKNTNDVFTL